MPDMQLTWLLFAKKIIEELKTFDKQEGTNYAYFFETPFGAKVLAEALEKANKRLEWQRAV